MNFDNLTPAARALVSGPEYNAFRTLENSVARAEKDIATLSVKSDALSLQELATVRKNLVSRQGELRALFAKATNRAAPAVDVAAVQA